MIDIKDDGVDNDYRYDCDNNNNNNNNNNNDDDYHDDHGALALSDVDTNNSKHGHDDNVVDDSDYNNTYCDDAVDYSDNNGDDHDNNSGNDVNIDIQESNRNSINDIKMMILKQADKDATGIY